MSDQIRILLVDDHPTLRLGLRVLLDHAPDLEVVGEAGDGSDALTQIEALRPHVVVLDCQLPGLSGYEVAMEVQRQKLPVRILALSAYRDEKYVGGMLEAGVLGYLLKEEAPTAIVAAVQAVSRGENWFSPTVETQSAAWARGERASEIELTTRERVVLRLIAEGRANKEIARQLKVAERTVEFHVTNLLSKLGVASRVEAAVWAKDHVLD
jgi:DNA-binding NarL/FixJ family response regulator